MFGRGKKKPIVVKRYDSEKSYEKDAQKMIEDGYEIQDVQVEDKGRGCLKWLSFGIFALLSGKKQEYVVTYRLTEREPKPT